MYRHRVFRQFEGAAAAAAVLGQYVDRMSTGTGHQDGPVGPDWREHVETYLADGAWTVLSVGATQVAAWSEGELVIHASGPWDEPLDAIPHTLLPWSWLGVGLEDELGGTSCELHHPLTAALVTTTVEDELISWLEPIGVDTLSVWGVLGSSAGAAHRSVRKQRGQLMVTEPISPALVEEGGDRLSLQRWWDHVLDGIGTKYGLGDRSGVASRAESHAGPIDEDELLLEVGPGVHVPEELLDRISSALIDMGATIDAWNGHPSHVGLPIAGPDLPGYLRRGAEMARAAGFTVTHPPSAP